ncbi:MAG: quinolinate synthase NadA [Candidatus Adiutrix sp.]|jgi:quinolinate synthase|nr:quinolinate synthase NadA [Candidatus Adiutrix sp.]
MGIETEIQQLKQQRQALILAHNYTLPEIQDAADFVGDSLELSVRARDCQAPLIVFCGVRFMAETAKILSPDSVVLHPNPRAGCPMADMAEVPAVERYRRDNPGTVLLAYVNTTAAVKTMVDICCTSGNAEAVLKSIPAGQKIMFLPDANLGRNLSAKLARPMELWPGFCPTHNRITPEIIRKAQSQWPGALTLVHLECHPSVVALADQALSTGGMLKYARSAASKRFIIGTESGLVYRLKKENPDKEFLTLSPEPLCPNMKKISLDDVLFALRDLAPAVELPGEVIEKARRPIEKMLAMK